MLATILTVHINYKSYCGKHEDEKVCSTRLMDRYDYGDLISDVQKALAEVI